MGKKKENKTAQTLVVGFIAFIMITSVIGFLYGGSDSTTKDKGYKFSITKNEYGIDIYQTKINNKLATFNSLPSDVEYIEMEQGIADRLKTTLQIDMTYDNDDLYAEPINLAYFLLAEELITMDIYSTVGQTSNTDNTPVITCNDSSIKYPVLYIKKAEVTKIISQENCIIAEAANDFDILRLKDRILYSIYGVI